MIHKAILGSIERFLAVYIEHTAGRFPLWLAPEQLRIITLNQTKEIEDYAEDLANKARELKLRPVVDSDNESVGKKIRNAETMKVPYTVVIGPKEVESGKVVPRIRQDLRDKETEVDSVSVDDLLEKLKEEYLQRNLKSSF